MPIVANVQATREHDYARKNSMTIVEVLPGMNIEDVAQAMCGRRYICKFNNFEIDGTEYQSAEEIVAAYKKNWEEGKRRLLESKKQQEQHDSMLRQQQLNTLINSQQQIVNANLQKGGLKR